MSGTLTKADLVDGIHDRLGIPKKEVVGLVELIFELIREELSRSDQVKISGFGNFSVREKAARKGRNPQTGDPLEIKARRVLTFRPSQILRDAVNEALKERPILESRRVGQR